MAVLNSTQVDQVAAYLNPLGLRPNIKAELLDHLCCLVEELMDEGQAFEPAFLQMQRYWPQGQLQKINKDIYFSTKIRPMLIRLLSSAAIIGGLCWALPFAFHVQDLGPDEFHFHALPNEQSTPPFAPEWQDPPTASPIAGMDLRDTHAGYGMVTHPITKERLLHRGIDLKAKLGTPVLATADGKVVFAGPNGDNGIQVRIQHTNGYVTVYNHLSKHQVVQWEEVHLGQKIAEVGSTGMSTGPHLHYEILKDDLPVDPLAFLD